ncbi:MAG TPA: glycoside hydrolase family 3 N-terminal domain-containing protein, partial [Candidatus Saccharicenans sp.]|nr:glycoside hydrolase family 3 N-terminal domain-containing protein [Candidatus Saccharicenans sp.]
MKNKRKQGVLNIGRLMSFRFLALLIISGLIFFPGPSKAERDSRVQENSDEKSATILPFLNPDLPLEVRVSDLVGRLSLEEKIGQLMNDAPAIDRLGIPAYNWWNECLHGVARAGLATVFPQAIGLAATWDTDLLFEVATAISDEARAKHHEAARRGERGIYQGLTFWSPNI